MGVEEMNADRTEGGHKCTSSVPGKGAAPCQREHIILANKPSAVLHKVQGQYLQSRQHSTRAIFGSLHQ